MQATVSGQPTALPPSLDARVSLRKRLRANLTAYLFLAPFLFVLSVFTLGATAYGLALSFCHYNYGIEPGPRFIGLDNYRYLWDQFLNNRDNFDFAILDFIHTFTGNPFHHGGPATAAFQINVLSADTLAFESGAIGYRNRYLANADFKPSDINGPGDQIFVRNVGDDVFVSADTRR